MLLFENNIVLPVKQSKLREKNDSSDYHCDNDDDENDDILDNGNNDLRT